jgi:methionyl-tRNA synthetase
LIREVPVGRDADFTRQRFDENYQAHLANGLGNLSSRIHTLCSKNGVTKNASPLDPEFAALLEKTEVNLTKAMNDFSLHEGITALWNLIEALDKKMDETKPWLLVKENPEQAKEVLTQFLTSLRFIATYLAPFLPETSERMKEMFGDDAALGAGQMLFPRLEKLQENIQK